MFTRNAAVGGSPARATARAGVLMTRQFASARTAPVWISLELSSDASRGESAISLAAGAVAAAVARSIPVGLSVRSAMLRTPAREGRGHADAILDALAALPSTADDPAVPHGTAFDFPAADRVLVISATDKAPAGRANVSHVSVPRAARAAS